MSRRIYYKCQNCEKITYNNNSREKLFCSRECYLQYRTKQNYSYHAIHTWLWRNYRHLKKGICTICSLKRRTEWANKSKIYKKDIKDYIGLCKPCHEKFDNKRHDLFKGRKHKLKSRKQISATLKKTFAKKQKNEK